MFLAMGSKYDFDVSGLRARPGESELLIQVRRQDKSWVIVYPFAIIL